MDIVSQDHRTATKVRPGLPRFSGLRIVAPGGYPWRSIGVLAWWAAKETSLRLSLYVVAAFGFAVASFLLRTVLGTIHTDQILVLANPLSLSIWTMTLIGAAFLALHSCIAVARERESGTLEVLFYGPVGYTDYVIARFLEAMIAYLLIVAMGVLYLLVMAAVTRFTVSAQTVSILALSVVVASCPITFALAVATLTGRMRSAMLVFVATLLIFGLIPLADTLLVGVPIGTDSTTALVYVRTAIALLDQLLSWVSPYAYVSRLIQPQTDASVIGYVGVLIVAVVYSSCCLSVAIWSLRRRGVRK